MACNPLRWLWGLIPLSMLSFLAFHWERPAIEADLALRSKETLREQRLDWAHTRFDGRDATLTGKAIEEREPKIAREVLRRIWGVRVVDARTDLVASITDFYWTAERTATDRVRLGGYVSDDEMRSAIVKRVRTAIPDVRIEDEMTVARGAPNEDFWLKGIEFSLAQLAHLKTGTVRLDKSSLSAEGEASNQGGYKSLREAIPKALPKGWKLGRAAIRPPAINPFTWTAELSGSQLVLTGFAPDEETREALFARAKRTFQRRAVVDRLEIASGAPKNFAAAAGIGLDQLQRLEEGTASLSGRELSLAGTARDEATATAVRGALQRAAPAGYRLSEKITALPPPLAAVSVFETSIVASDDGVDVTGYVPSEEDRDALLSAVRSAYPGQRIGDRLELAAGAPDGWQTCALAGITALGRLGTGTLKLTDAALELSGVTRDQALATSISKGLQSTAGAACEVTPSIVVDLPREPNLWWQALYTNGAIVLEGQAPDTRQKNDLLEVVAESFPGARIEDRMVVVSKPSTKWQVATKAAVQNLSRLHHGTAMLFLDDIYITGEAPSEATVDAVQAGLTSDLPAGYIGRHSITIVDREAIRIAEEEAEAKRRAAEAEAERQAQEEARRRQEEERARLLSVAREAKVARAPRPRTAEVEECQRLLRQTATSGTILFEYASDELSRRSRPTLNKLAKLVTECPDARIEVEGHTDSDGDPDRNQRLSVRRAQSVVSYLVEAGIEEERLSAVGYGPARPVAPNDTTANKAKNRRIEFLVVAE